jgi:hypothetical protein
LLVLERTATILGIITNTPNPQSVDT